MELTRPSEIKVDEVTGAMLRDLDELAHQVNEIRPLDDQVLRQVKDELLGERVFNSNAIEGSTLTMRETRLILQSKTYLDVRRKREAQEALNLGEAANKIEELLESDGAWHDASRFLELHQILMKGVSDRIAGVLRNRDVMITGAKHQPPGSHYVPALIDEFFRYLSEAEQATGGLVLATWCTGRSLVFILSKTATVVSPDFGRTCFCFGPGSPLLSFGLRIVRPISTR